MDTDIIKSDWYLLTIIFLNGLRLIFQLLTLKRQARNKTITKENLETSSAVKTLLLLDRYASEYLTILRGKYWRK